MKNNWSWIEIYGDLWEGMLFQGYFNLNVIKKNR